MFGRWLRGISESDAAPGAEQLQLTLRAELPEMDEESVLVVCAIVGLLGAVAYADSHFSTEEQSRVREELSRINGLSARGIDSVCNALQKHILEIATVQVPRYARILRELADVELRLQVLDMLVALAAADDVITSAETNAMRQITTSLGLAQADYNAAQSKHKDKLAVLKGGL